MPYWSFLSLFYHGVTFWVFQVRLHKSFLTNELRTLGHFVIGVHHGCAKEKEEQLERRTLVAQFSADWLGPNPLLLAFGGKLKRRLKKRKRKKKPRKRKKKPRKRSAPDSTERTFIILGFYAGIALLIPHRALSLCHLPCR